MYLIPAIIAGVRDIRCQNTILVLNLLLGWTFIIWLALILWAVIERREYKWPTAEEETLTREQFLSDERKGWMS